MKTSRLNETNPVTVFHAPAATNNSVERETIKKIPAIASSLDERPIPGVVVEVPQPATRDDLELAHSAEYVEAVLTGEPGWLAGSSGVGEWHPGLAESVVHTTGGVIAATLRALETGRPCCALAAGLHHAKFTSGEGFCTINGLVVGARRALASGATRVLIIDFDQHCGGGTASIIREVQGVEQVDVAGNPFDHYRSDATSTLTMIGSIETGVQYLDVVERALASIEEPARIDLVIYNAGVDVAGMAGGLAPVDPSVIRARERMVFEWTKANNIPVAWVLAGGYTVGCTMDELVELHRIAMEEAVAVYS